MNKYFILLSAGLLVACNGFMSMKSIFKNISPYERYVESLKKAELLNASMTQEWLSAGSAVFDDSVILSLPFSESGFFAASTPQARGYRFDVKEGQVLTIGGAVKTAGDAKVFMDLFVREEDKWDHIAFADSAFSITHEFSDAQECVLRVQPELLANTYYAINISLTPVLVNPVFGASNKSIQSFYGASRDNGKRSHEGVDIFARRGTPVIAPTNGLITRVGWNNLGGKVVWMRDAQRGHSYYFAHLDSQMVKPGMRVEQGHVLGLVGNTGNARYTPPHLHFGIYESGSKDPLYYIQKVGEAMASLPIDTGFQQKPARIASRKASLMAGPSVKLPVKTHLYRNTYVTIIAQSQQWYRVALPDESQGYVQKKYVTALTSGAVSRLDSTAVLLSAIHAGAVPIAILKAETAVEILACYGDYNFVKTEEGNAGWLHDGAPI